MEMEEGFPELLKDEFMAIFSIACLNLSKIQFSSGRFLDAMHYAQKSVEYADHGVYSNAANKSEGIMILAKSSEKLKGSLTEY